MSVDALADRRTFIGGSDAAAACGVCPWKTPVDLWLLKTGRKDEDDLSDNEAVYWGNRLEHEVRDEYELKTGYSIEPGDFVQHRSIAFMAANTDGYAKPTGQKKRVLELKTAGVRQSHLWGEPGTDAVPMNYVCQVMHYMEVCGLDVADIAVLVGGQRFRIYTVERDDELVDWMIEREAAFWECVKSDKPPEPLRVGDAAKIHPESFGRSVVASGAIKQAVEDVRVIDIVAKQMQERRDGLAESIQLYMEDAERLDDEDGETLATWKSSKVERIDVKLLEKNLPSVADEYRRATVYRRFLVKKGRE